MKIGISIPWAFISGISTDIGTEALNNQIYKINDFLFDLKKQGIYSIELRHWQNEILPAADNVFDLIKKTGLQVTVHGDVEENQDSQEITKSFPWLLSCLKNNSFNEEQKLIITLHPINNKKNSIDINYDKSISILRHLDLEIKSKNLPIIIAYENQREKGYPDPGIYYEKLVSAVKEINSSNIGICWDMGHAYCNILRKLLAENPPEEFISEVVHTHIHDLHPETKSTHWPLSCRTIPLQRYINYLKENKYSGIYNLEFSPNKFKSEKISEVYKNSIKILVRATE